MKMIFCYLVLAWCCSGLLACSILQRSFQSGYDNDTYEFRAGQSGREFYREKQNLLENEAREELGLDNALELNEAQSNALNSRLSLKRAEKNLANQREKRQYFNYKSAMRTDAERLYFLSLPSVDARERWALQKGLNGKNEDHPVINTIIEKNDVTLGMSQNAVIQSWGDPDIVEVAGNPVYRNERWKYTKMISGDEGFQQQTRVIYFESGRVVGWETY